MKLSTALLAVAFLIGFLTAACGSATPAAQPASEGTGAEGATQVTIQSFSFQPATLTVPSGTTVTWTNKDNVAHTVTADDASWDSGSLTPGQTFSRTFEMAGAFQYHCTPHQRMVGTIVVTE
jgi:plastocyanin